MSGRCKLGRDGEALTNGAIGPTGRAFESPHTQRYHLGITPFMAMTLRLTGEDERILAWLAAEDGVSRQEATIRALHEVAARRGHERAVSDSSRRARSRYADVIDRLSR